MGDSRLLVERHGPILAIGLNRAEKFNAIDVDMFFDMARAYGELDRNSDFRIGVVHAYGEHFCAGLDLTKWQDIITSGEMPALPDGSCDPFALNIEKTCRKPLIFAVQGICYTFGVESMLAADIRIASSDARFAQLEVKRGIFPFGGATLRLAVEIGWANSMRYLLSGDELSAQEAHRLGLIQELVDRGQQYERAMQLAERIAWQAPLAVQATLASARRMRAAMEIHEIKQLFPQLLALSKTEDVKEGLRSFVERRKANFEGR